MRLLTTITSIALTSQVLAANLELPRDELALAHKSYVKGNLSKMVGSIKHIMTNPDFSQFERDNAVHLWSEAMKERGKLPSDWRLPKSIYKLKVGIKRTDSEGSIRYNMKVKGDTTKVDTVKQLQIVKYPDTVIIDKQSRVYDEWEEDVWDGIPEFKGQSIDQKAQFEKGLYLLNIDTYAGEKVRGWFIISDENSTGSPEVYTPQIDEKMTGTHPIVRFEDYRSPEYQGYEYRSRWVGLTKLLNPGWKWLWGHYQNEPRGTEVALGSASEDSGKRVELDPSRYWLTVAFTETKKFGDLRLLRESRTARSFEVVK